MYACSSSMSSSNVVRILSYSISGFPLSVLYVRNMMSQACTTAMSNSLPMIGEFKCRLHCSNDRSPHLARLSILRLHNTVGYGVAHTLAEMPLSLSDQQEEAGMLHDTVGQQCCNKNQVHSENNQCSNQTRLCRLHTLNHMLFMMGRIEPRNLQEATKTYCKSLLTCNLLWLLLLPADVTTLLMTFQDGWHISDNIMLKGL